VSGTRSLRHDLRHTKIRFVLLALLIPATFVGGATVVSNGQVASFLGIAIGPLTIGRQLDTPAASITAQDRRRYWGFAGEPDSQMPLVLAFHDIQEHPTSAYAITPQRFESHMAMLEAAGFTSITSEQLAAYLHGADLPPRTVMLTFDDGTHGIWTYADAILKRHRFHGIAFVITGSVEERQASYYLTWSELRRMQRSGRWDIESHSRNGHGLVKVNARGSKGPFFVSRQWLPGKNRRESLEEFANRVGEDLNGSIEDLRRNALPAPRFFAHPLSAGVRDASDPATIGIVFRLLRARFVASMTNSDLPHAIDRGLGARGALPRLEVLRDTTTPELFARIAAASPRPVASMNPFRSPRLWMDSNGRPLEAGISGELFVFWPRRREWAEAYFAPGRTSSWVDYQASFTVAGLADGRTTAGLTVLSGSTAEHRVSVSARLMSVRVGTPGKYRTVVERRLPYADRHRIVVTVLQGHVQVLVDSEPVITASTALRRPFPTGGISLYTYQPRHTPSLPTFHNLRITPVRGVDQDPTSCSTLHKLGHS
jgi:poly-beta-1,6-N-acetyl-D-glucosamine N-deacetylase